MIEFKRGKEGRKADRQVVGYVIRQVTICSILLCKDGHNKKDRNGMDQTEAEDIKKRWQECTE